MADSAAIYGLVGALGGALLGAGAATAASLIQHRDVKRTRRLARDDAELTRLVALRSTTRAALRVRSEAVRAMESGKPIDTAKLLSALDSTWVAAEKAADAAAADGLYFVMSTESEDAQFRRDLRRLARFTGERMGALRTIDENIHAAAQQYQQSGTVPPDYLADDMRDLERWRAELLGELLDRMDVLRGRAREE
ncbi:hypothetical protein [Streptomyces sp. NPDC057257]|uniref:hypothetical protein n=1 Tax=Streptomyces sp. NPDC057257 TaxID=3346071 RepID=UPI00362562EC